MAVGAAFNSQGGGIRRQFTTERNGSAQAGLPHRIVPPLGSTVDVRTGGAGGRTVDAGDVLTMSMYQDSAVAMNARDTHTWMLVEGYLR